mmetsp:Transcript_18038/g.41029  ORF Transcript_18038/g.41029 Transcript_18038/m.41029 type:complete len:207 (-) Transcript_18038:1388-2008(-)
MRRLPRNHGIPLAQKRHHFGIHGLLRLHRRRGHLVPHDVLPPQRLLEPRGNVHVGHEHLVLIPWKHVGAGGLVLSAVAAEEMFPVYGRELVARHDGSVEVFEGGFFGFGAADVLVDGDVDLCFVFVEVFVAGGALAGEEEGPGPVEAAVFLIVDMEGLESVAFQDFDNVGTVAVARDLVRCRIFRHGFSQLQHDDAIFRQRVEKRF